MTNSFFYFAYGSSMDTSDLRFWCEINRLTPIYPISQEAACLKNYKLIFHYRDKFLNSGIADIIEQDNEEVWGILFKLAIIHKTTIRKKEGFPDTFREIEISVQTLVNHVKTRAITYTLKENKKENSLVAPTKYYKQLLLNNARRLYFPNLYIKQLEAISAKDHG